MKSPEFQPWIHWSCRSEIGGGNLPGIYLLAQFSDEPDEVVDPSADQVIYIGETCNQFLAKRWYQFNRSAFELKPGHSGGVTFATQFCDNQRIDPPNWLYVSALPINIDEPQRSAYIRFIERWAIWLFVERHGRMPICNSK